MTITAGTAPDTVAVLGTVALDTVAVLGCGSERFLLGLHKWVAADLAAEDKAVAHIEAVVDHSPVGDRAAEGTAVDDTGEAEHTVVVVVVVAVGAD